MAGWLDGWMAYIRGIFGDRSVLAFNNPMVRCSRCFAQ